MARVEVRKTHKLYIGGAFPRSESGRTYKALDAKGRFIANMAKASRKDARDAVRAARSAFPGWSTRTPYNRGQVIYRIAEVMEGRRDQLVDQLREATGITAKVAEKRVDVTIDRVVWANTFNKFDPTSPFGGYQESGYGREGGRHGLAAYLKGHSA